MTEPTIPGTADLPDNPLHRASLWVERFIKRMAARERGTRQMADGEGVRDLEILARETEIRMTGKELLDGAEFYAANLSRAFFGRIGLHVKTTAGFASIETIILSVWLDGFEHGAATAADKRADFEDEPA